MSLFDDALMFALERHHGMVRKKNAGIPYLLHPMEAAVIVGTMTNDQEILSLDSMQSTTAADVRDGADYLEIMRKNLTALKGALG